MEVADLPAAEPADHGKAHRQPSTRRDEHQELHGPQLGQVPQALLGDQMLLIGVGKERDGGVQVEEEDDEEEDDDDDEEFEDEDGDGSDGSFIDHPLAHEVLN